MFFWMVRVCRRCSERRRARSVCDPANAGSGSRAFSQCFLPLTTMARRRRRAIQLQIHVLGLHPHSGAHLPTSGRPPTSPRLTTAVDDAHGQLSRKPTTTTPPSQRRTTAGYVRASDATSWGGWIRQRRGWWKRQQRRSRAMGRAGGWRAFWIAGQRHMGASPLISFLPFFILSLAFINRPLS